jgi:alpha-glucosidase
MFWASELKAYAADGVSGIWNDMNEFSTWGQKAPDNILFNYEGKGASHLQIHNVYGLEMIRSSYEGYRAALGGNKRPFVLTRSGYAGLQRFAALWTGDNRAEDSHMMLGISLMNSLGLKRRAIYRYGCWRLYRRCIGATLRPLDADWSI